eukprot:4557175-Prymnesium_polylepis.1
MYRSSACFRSLVNSVDEDDERAQLPRRLQQFAALIRVFVVDVKGEKILVFVIPIGSQYARQLLHADRQWQQPRSRVGLLRCQDGSELLCRPGFPGASPRADENRVRVAAPL